MKEITDILQGIGNALEGINGQGGFVKLNNTLVDISESLREINHTLICMNDLGIAVSIDNDKKKRIPIDVDFPSEIHANLDHNNNPIRVRHYPEIR